MDGSIVDNYRPRLNIDWHDTKKSKIIKNIYLNIIIFLTKKTHFLDNHYLKLKIHYN